MKEDQLQAWRRHDSTAIRPSAATGRAVWAIRSASTRAGPTRAVRRGLSAIIERMADLSRSDVEHVAYLARLGLTDAELTRLEVELNHILDQYAILAGLPTDDIPPTAQTIELENILREDVVKPSLPVEAVLRNAPARQGDFIVVPAILDER
jgi:aspartyl-tRNA(Asn)/glutamyl-tRNA(Gln) amidotransferase subunit C